MLHLMILMSSLEGSSPLSSDEGSSSYEEEHLREVTLPTPPKAFEFVLHNSVNFRMGSGCKQVMADYSKPSLPSP